jgi:hypothetical protein
MDSQCSGTNKDGRPCSAHVDAGQSWCRWHDPARESDRAEWRRKGGTARSNRNRAKKQLADQAMSIADIDAVLCLALKKVAVGTMPPGVGSSMAGIAKAVVTIRTASDMEKRLEALELQAGVGTIRRFS